MGDDDDEFMLDDDLDGLADNTLQELELNAFASTQRAKTALQQSRPVQKPLRKPSSLTAPLARPGLQPSRPSGPVTSRYAAKAALDAETEAAFAAADAELGAHAPKGWDLEAEASNGVDLAALQARVAELEAEQVRLRQAEQDARDAASRKQGEIAIVRANHDKTTKEYERRIAVMQKLHRDEAMKTKAELEAGKKEREKMETDNRFLQHDLAQESERAKRLNGPGKARSAVTAMEQETPRKAKRMVQGDGFDDHEVHVISPSKSKDKPKDVTPKHASKRKRTANDSPVAPLSFTHPAGVVRQESTEQPTNVGYVAASDRLAEDKRFEFMQRLLNHSPFQGHEHTLEALAKHSLPSTAGKSIATFLTDELARPAIPEKQEYLPLKLSRAVFQLWTRCLNEKHFAPLYLLLDLIRFALHLEPSSTACQLIDDAVSLGIRTIEPFASATARAAINPTFAATLDRPAREKLEDDICADEVLDLLLQLAQAAELYTDRIIAFWRVVEMPFILLMLHKAQPIYQITTALQILATSALDGTNGPISSDAETQAEQEPLIVDRLTCLLFEMPEPAHDEPAYTDAEIADLRLQVLDVLKAICRTDHGGLLIASHKSAIGRLVRFIDAQVNKLYTLPPSMLCPSGITSAHGLVAQTVNLAVRLFYHLLRMYDTIDLNQKLSTVFGGHHKFLVGMSRVAFSEQLVLEYGLEDEVVEAAHTILNNSLSPEEGEALVQALETPRGSKGSEVRIPVRRGQEAEHNGDTEMAEAG
ncbi:hypothetical protein BAUCODRAFT_70256 [Baudoinia panamericana UAMH 10762]|uniref:DNA repair protein Rad26 n=1 Tax=Baudoinia panamericana (strain UAMH 10762) TaxID=717646 RepID=M2MXR1_BAUPA|nr:uncharacterized protein BAUCODRAFT_70256 [Baudoinia panamericana UAMH 10762]EMC96358.1 hypothetical protein BAUCODRAFT_70256 [Baudoinia panamericana UAMH 10762]